jgi:hypothetical protein
MVRDVATADVQMWLVAAQKLEGGYGSICMSE